MTELTLTGFGAVPDALELRDAAMVTGTDILTSASAPFVEEDVGKSITVGGAGAAGAKLSATIATFLSATQVTLSASASTSVIGAGAVYGTDCAGALGTALDALLEGRGGTLVVDGLFFLASPVDKSFGSETNGIGVRLVGTGTDSAIWISTAATQDAITLTSASIELANLNFVGVPGATRDARRILNLQSVRASFAECGFYGLMGADAVIYADQCLLQTRGCAFGGSFVAAGAAGYTNSVIENKNWRGYRDDDSAFIDYGYFRGRLYTKSGFATLLGWIRADSPSGNVGARGESVFRLRGTVLDEGALHGIVAKPTTGSIAHVQLLGLRQNITNAENGRGIHCEDVGSVVIQDCWQGLATIPALAGYFKDCGTVLIDSLKLSDSVNKLWAVNVEALTLKDTVGITSFAFTNVNFHPVRSRYGSLGLVKDGAIADSDFAAPPALGTLAFDRTNNRLYVKRVTTGGWIYFDMSGGDPFGPELVVNGTFGDGTTTGWTPKGSGILSVVDGALRVTNAAIYGRAQQAIPVVVGQTYQVSATIVGGDAGRLIRVGTSEVAGNYAAFFGTGGTATFTATTSTCYIALMLDSEQLGKYAEFDNISLRAI